MACTVASRRGGFGFNFLLGALPVWCLHVFAVAAWALSTYSHAPKTFTPG